MALCAYCQKDTEMYDGGTPVCIACSDVQEAKRKPSASQLPLASRLQREVAAATARADAANAAFHALIREVPSGIPQPDGNLRLQNASRELSVARTAVMEATRRLNNFLDYGTVPEDLQR